MTLLDSFGVCKVRASMETLPRSSKKREGPEVPRLTSKIKEEECHLDLDDYPDPKKRTLVKD